MWLLTKIPFPISTKTGLLHCSYDSYPGRRFVRYWSVFWVPDLQNYVSWTWRFHDSVILSNNMHWQGCGKNQWWERNVMRPCWLAQIVEHRFYDLFELCCTCWKVRDSARDFFVWSRIVPADFRRSTTWTKSVTSHLDFSYLAITRRPHKVPWRRMLHKDSQLWMDQDPLWNQIKAPNQKSIFSRISQLFPMVEREDPGNEVGIWHVVTFSFIACQSQEYWMGNQMLHSPDVYSRSI